MTRADVTARAERAVGSGARRARRRRRGRGRCARRTLRADGVPLDAAAPHRRWILRMRGARSGRQSRGDRGGVTAWKSLEAGCTGHALFAGLLAPLPSRSGAATWPAITQSAKPWTRWWWPGSAVDRAQLTAQLEAIAAAGIGGVEITPIYGARGSEARYIDFLSPRWMEMLEHTTREAARLGLGVDMATGTGWPFGGPWVSAGGRLEQRSRCVDGKLTGKPTAMKVKRAAPGGEGLVLDPYSTAALDRYLRAVLQGVRGIRRAALGARPVPRFLRVLQRELDAGAAGGVSRRCTATTSSRSPRSSRGEQPVDDDTLGRVKGDYRRTLAKLHLDYVKLGHLVARATDSRRATRRTARPAICWICTRVADIPETESFGLTPLPISGLRARSRRRQRRSGSAVGNLIGRFASSAAHVDGPAAGLERDADLAAREFPRVARRGEAAARPAVRRRHQSHLLSRHRLLAGRRRSGRAGSSTPRRSSHPTNPLWDDFGAMHAYVARVQSVLQAGKPDNDILLYWPFDDRRRRRATGSCSQLGVHENEWLTEAAAGRLAAQTTRRGYSLRLHLRRAAPSAARRRRRARRAGCSVIARSWFPPRAACRSRRWRSLVELRKAGRDGHLRVAAAGRPGLRPPRSAPREVARAARLAGARAPRWPADIVRRARDARRPARAGRAGGPRATSAARAPMATTTSSRTSAARGIRRLAAARDPGGFAHDAGSADRPHRHGRRARADAAAVCRSIYSSRPANPRSSAPSERQRAAARSQPGVTSRQRATGVRIAGRMAAASSSQADRAAGAARA